MILFLTVSSVVSARSRTPAPADSIGKSLKTNNTHRAFLCALLDTTYRSHAIHQRRIPNDSAHTTSCHVSCGNLQLVRLHPEPACCGLCKSFTALINDLRWRLLTTSPTARSSMRFNVSPASSPDTYFLVVVFWKFPGSARRRFEISGGVDFFSRRFLVNFEEMRVDMWIRTTKCAG